MPNTRWALRDSDTYSTYQTTEIVGKILINGRSLIS